MYLSYACEPAHVAFVLGQVKVGDALDAASSVDLAPQHHLVIGTRSFFLLQQQQQQRHIKVWISHHSIILSYACAAGSYSSSSSSSSSSWQLTRSSTLTPDKALTVPEGRNHY
jgi:hypothetical protein